MFRNFSVASVDVPARAVLLSCHGSLFSTVSSFLDSVCKRIDVQVIARASEGISRGHPPRVFPFVFRWKHSAACCPAGCTERWHPRILLATLQVRSLEPPISKLPPSFCHICAHITRAQAMNTSTTNRYHMHLVLCMRRAVANRVQRSGV